MLPFEFDLNKSYIKVNNVIYVIPLQLSKLLTFIPNTQR